MNYRSLITYFAKKITRDNITAYAAQAALFIMLSGIPFLLVFVSLIRYTPVQQDTVIKFVQYLLPGDVSPWISSILREVYTNSTSVVIATLVFAIYSAAKCVHSLRNGLNTVYEVKETRNWFKLRLRAMVETFALILAIIMLLLLVVFGEKLKDLQNGSFPLLEHVFRILLDGRHVIVFVALTLIFTFIFKAIPNRTATYRSQLFGAVGCAVAWYVFSYGLAICIRFFNGFSFYGSLTTMVLVMFWLDICMIIFLICGEVNNAFEMIVAEFRRSRKVRRARQNGEVLDDEEEHIDPFQVRIDAMNRVAQVEEEELFMKEPAETEIFGRGSTRKFRKKKKKNNQMKLTSGNQQPSVKQTKHSGHHMNRMNDTAEPEKPRSVQESQQVDQPVMQRPVYATEPERLHSVQEEQSDRQQSAHDAAELTEETHSVNGAGTLFEQPSEPQYTDDAQQMQYRTFPSTPDSGRRETLDTEQEQQDSKLTILTFPDRFKDSGQKEPEVKLADKGTQVRKSYKLKRRRRRK